MNKFAPIAAYDTQIKNDEGFVAMNLFGNRFQPDQTELELLSEFLLILSSPKAIKYKNTVADQSFVIRDYLPPLDKIDEIFDSTLMYKPEYKINLKLFSILPNSSKAAPHKSHQAEYNYLQKELKKRLTICAPNIPSPDTLSLILSNLYMGFIGIGENRDWVAQSFLPIHKEFLAGESIWKATKAKKADIEDFQKALPFFEHKEHLFYARGGEIMYLQILSVLRKTKNEIDNWVKDNKEIENIDIIETDPELIVKKLGEGFNKLLNESCPNSLGEIAKLINNLDPVVKESSYDEYTKYINMGWIPLESWTDGFLFIQVLLHIFEASFDMIEKLQMLQNACVLQVLRTMRNSTIRYYKELNLPCPFSNQIVIDPKSIDVQFKEISNESLQSLRKGIKQAIEQKAKEIDFKGQLKNIHTKYGDKLYLRYAKRLNLVIPYSGGNEHYVLTKSLLTYLVATSIRPNNRVTLHTFLNIIRTRYGFVFDFDGISETSKYLNSKKQITREVPESWLIEMLDESGFLISLSDGYSLVENNLGGLTK